jgi:hypothetical protein
MKRRRSTTCTICKHPERHRIEMLRIGGASLDAVAEKFGVGRDAIHRHVANHIEPEMRANYLAGPIALHQLAQRAADEGVSLLDYLSIVRSTLIRMFDVAASVGDRNGVAVISGRLLETLREIGKFTGELRDVGNVTVNNNLLVLQSPLFAEAQLAVIGALKDFPDARTAVIRELRALEERKKAESTPRLIEHREIEAAHA